jgi:hypothetical protein
MGAFIGYGEIGVWASNSERNAFLDWFAANRCPPGDPRRDFCEGEGNRWSGCCIDLSELLPEGEPLQLTEEEYSQAKDAYWPNLAQLLSIIDSITRREWRIEIDSKAAISWRRPKIGLE